jgi:3-hydroxybutyryl-CoA dehydrogenase
MAPESAAARAAAGGPVVVCGRSPERADAAARRATALAGGGEISAVVLDERAFADAELVVESVAEDLALKRELLARIEAWSPPRAILATNTSSLRIADIASALARPARFAGLHFLKPGHLTAVVEVVPGPATDAAVVTGLEARAAAMGKAPLVVRADVPGFIWNRIQFAVLRECLHMLEAGVADAADIDAAVSDGLAPRWMAAGPLATADLGGLDVFATVSAQLFPHLADDREAPELARRAAEGQAFAPWTARGGEEVGALRARALELGREIAARRRELGA